MAKHSVADDGDPRKYYAAIPNIVLTLGLHPFELALYAYLKKVAGEDGVCWKSRATIARETKMSAGMVTKCKEALARPRRELNGKPLIVVTEQMQNGGNANQLITITDIWPENMAELERVRLEKARSHGDGEELTRSPHDARGHTVTSTRSPRGHKEEPVKKNQEEDKPRSRADLVRSVFGFWQTHLDHPAAMLDDRRESVISRRLKDGYTADQLMDAIRGCAMSDFHMGREPGKPQRHDGITLICRDAEHVDKFIAIYRGNGNGTATRTQTLREQLAAREAAQ